MNLICYYSQSSSPDDHAARVEKLIVQCESGEKLKLNRQTDDISNKKKMQSVVRRFIGGQRRHELLWEHFVDGSRESDTFFG